eukprot:superscaffoldBa00003843_g17815
MSLEDLDINFQSDESDYDDEAGKNSGVVEDDYQAMFNELVQMHNDLMYFEHIYMNNIDMDMQYMENEGGSSFSHNSGDSEMALVQDYIHSIMEDISLLLTDSSESSPVTSHGDGSSSGTEDNGLSFTEDFVQLYEEVIETSSSSWSTVSDDDADGQITNTDDTDSLQDGDAEGQ